MHPAHQNGQFVVPRRDESPDVGVVPVTYTEPVQDEIAELACGHLPKLVARETNLAILTAFGLEVMAMLNRRAAADIEDFPRQAASTESPTITSEQWRKIVAAELGRILDWICKGRRVPDMGVRAFVVASHIRRSAIDNRTDRQAALEIGNNSRASVNKTKGEFRRALGADYPGENGKSSNTKTRCKNSRIKQLKS